MTNLFLFSLFTKKYLQIFNIKQEMCALQNMPVYINYQTVIMWPSLEKIQYTELKLSCGEDPVVKNYIYSNSNLDLWPNDPKINKVLPLPQGNHLAKFVKDPIYRTKVMWKRLLSKIIFIVTVTVTFDLMTPK